MKNHQKFKHIRREIYIYRYELHTPYTLKSEKHLPTYPARVESEHGEAKRQRKRTEHTRANERSNTQMDTETQHKRIR